MKATRMTQNYGRKLVVNVLIPLGHNNHSCSSNCNFSRERKNCLIQIVSALIFCVFTVFRFFSFSWYSSPFSTTVLHQQVHFCFAQFCLLFVFSKSLYIICMAQLWYEYISDRVPKQTISVCVCGYGVFCVGIHDGLESAAKSVAPNRQQHILDCATVSRLLLKFHPMHMQYGQQMQTTL